MCGKGIGRVPYAYGKVDGCQGAEPVQVEGERTAMKKEVDGGKGRKTINQPAVWSKQSHNHARVGGL
jgi:hypothetical protein